MVARVLGPMPDTRSSSSTELKGRSAIIAAALAGPMPGSVSSNSSEAVLTLISPPLDAFWAAPAAPRPPGPIVPTDR